MPASRMTFCHLTWSSFRNTADSTILSKGQISLSCKKRKLMVKLCEPVLLDFEANPEIGGSFEQTRQAALSDFRS
jgi:hypothetical protein